MPSIPADSPDPVGLALAPGVVVGASAVRWAFSRSAGPGGQNVNKLSTKAELRIDVEAIPISGRARARLRNLAGRRIIGAEMFVDDQGRERVRGGELVLTAETDRSQSGNRQACLAKLRGLLVQAIAEPKVRRKTKPTLASRERRLEGKKRRSDIKRGRRGGE